MARTVATPNERRDRAMALPQLGHVAALDGIRGIAVAIVVLHHLQVPGIHGGWLGVDLFFALSGFLITQSVLGMGTGTGLGDFWRRRAWRLGPAMSVLLAWYLVGWLAFDLEAGDGSMRARWWLSSVFQVLNVHDAFSKHGPFSDHLGHLWSLSAEVQFYVLWPLLLTVLIRRGAGRMTILAVAVGLFAASSVLRTILALQDVQWNRLYLGPDTRSSALWAGCAVGLLHFWGAFRRSPVLRPIARELAMPALVGLTALVALPAMAFSTDRVPYYWGITLVGIGAASLVAVGAADRGGPIRWLLETPPLEWLGRISFSVYLWHVPLIAQLRESAPDMGAPGRVAIIVPASILAGWASYTLVERPLLSAAGRARLRARLRPRSAPVG